MRNAAQSSARLYQRSIAFSYSPRLGTRPSHTASPRATTDRSGRVPKHGNGVHASWSAAPEARPRRDRSRRSRHSSTNAIDAPLELSRGRDPTLRDSCDGTWESWGTIPSGSSSGSPARSPDRARRRRARVSDLAVRKAGRVVQPDVVGIRGLHSAQIAAASSRRPARRWNSAISDRGCGLPPQPSSIARSSNAMASSCATLPVVLASEIRVALGIQSSPVSGRSDQLVEDRSRHVEVAVLQSLLEGHAD